MDAEDDSKPGTIKYLVYRKRKALEFQHQMLMLRYAGGNVFDPDNAIKKLTEEWYPENPEHKLIELAEKNRELAAETAKTLTIVKGKDGRPKLRIR